MTDEATPDFFGQLSAPRSLADIFVLQDLLNRRCGNNVSEAALQIYNYKPKSSAPLPDEVEAACDMVRDYALAGVMETAELIDCVLWKSWTTEAREGRRWQWVRLSTDDEMPYGKQNAVVEATDLLFFAASVAALLAISPLDIENHVSKFTLASNTPDETCSPRSIVVQAVRISELFAVIANTTSAALLRHSNEFMTAVEHVKSIFVHLLAGVFPVLGVTRMESIGELYMQKFRINWRRQARDYKQVNDPHSVAENKSIEVESGSTSTSKS